MSVNKKQTKMKQFFALAFLSSTNASKIGDLCTTQSPCTTPQTCVLDVEPHFCSDRCETNNDCQQDGQPFQCAGDGYCAPDTNIPDEPKAPTPSPPTTEPTSSPTPVPTSTPTYVPPSPSKSSSVPPSTPTPASPTPAPMSSSAPASQPIADTPSSEPLTPTTTAPSPESQPMPSFVPSVAPETTTPSPEPIPIPTPTPIAPSPEPTPEPAPIPTPTEDDFGKSCVHPVDCKGTHSTKSLLCVETDVYGSYCTYKGCTAQKNTPYACPSETPTSKWKCVVPVGHTSHYCFRDYIPTGGDPVPDPDPVPAPDPSGTTPSPVTPSNPPAGDTSCIGWRQTGGCTPWGKREPENDLDCESTISKGSGYCECGDGTTAAQVGCGHDAFTCKDACKLLSYEVPLFSSSEASPWSSSSSSCGTCGTDNSKFDPNDEDASGQGSICQNYKGTEPNAGSLTGTCICGTGYHGIGCSLALVNSFKLYSAASSTISIPLSVRIPVTVQGIHYQSVFDTYLISLVRDVILEVSKSLKVAPGRIDTDPTSLKLDGSKSSYLDWMDGTTITIPLIIHAPIDMSDITDPLIGTTKEMNDLSSKIEQALKSPWSKLRMNGSPILNTISSKTCCGRILLNAPSLKFTPTFMTFNIDITKMDKYTGYEIQTLEIINTVRGSNPAVIESIAPSQPIAKWISIKRIGSSFPISVKNEKSMMISIQVDRKIVATMPSGSYFQVIAVNHRLIDNSPHSITVRLEITDGGSNNNQGGNAGNGNSGNGGNDIINNNPTIKGNGTNSFEEIIDEPGFIPGAILGASALCVLLALFFCIRKCCCSCCCKTSDRRRQLQKANKKKGTPSTKFSKISFEEDDDLDGLELAVSSKSSSSFNRSSNNNEFGIVRGQNATHSTTLQPSSFSSSSSSTTSTSNTLRLVPGTTLDPDDFEPTWQSMDLTKLWGSTLKSLPTEQEWEDLLAADSIICMASGQVDDTQKFYFYAKDSFSKLYLIEASITKSSKRLACVFKTSSNKGSTMKELEEFIVLFKNRIVGYLSKF